LQYYEVREQHLDLLATAAQLCERLRFGQGAGNIACGLIHIADDVAPACLGSTSL
jgi:hypothetical protein